MLARETLDRNHTVLYLGESQGKGRKLGETKFEQLSCLSERSKRHGIIADHEELKKAVVAQQVQCSGLRRVSGVFIRVIGLRAHQERVSAEVGQFARNAFLAS